VEELTGLNENGCYTEGYADNIAILIRRKFQNNVSELLQSRTLSQSFYRRP
jgi:hypothetical protein